MYTPQKLKKKETTQLPWSGPMATEAAFTPTNASSHKKSLQSDLHNS